MTLARRVTALEATLSPTQLVLRWLAEAHSHGSLTAYVAAILDDEPEDFPLNRLCREAVAGARAGTGKRAREQTEAAVRAALQQTVFRFELVLRINITTLELLDKQGLVDAVLCGHLAMLASGHPPIAAGGPAVAEQLGSSRDLALRRVGELHACQEARSLVESRYLDGHPALFPDGFQEWEEQVAATERLAVMADRLSELDGAARPSFDMPDAIAARVPSAVADLVEPAKVTALEKIGEGDRAIRIATSWVRGRAPKAVL